MNLKILVLSVCSLGVSVLSCGGSDEPADLQFGSVAQALGHAVPGRIEAEAFDNFYDTTPAHFGDCGAGPVDLQITADPNGGGCNVGWTEPGEWLEYDLTVAKAGMFDVAFRVASAQAGRTFHVEVDGSDVSGALMVPASGWQAWEERGVQALPLSVGSHTLRVVFDNGATNFNYLEVIEVPSTSVAVPARIEAETYQRFSDTTPGNAGGACDTGDAVDKQLTSDPNGGVCNIGWTAPGEWLEYDLTVVSAGDFDVALRVASAQSNRTLHVEVDGSAVPGTLTSPATGWQSYENRTVRVPLSAGDHRLRIVFDTGSVNLNYVDVTAASSTVTIPARLQAQDYDHFSDSTPANQGGACDTGDAVDKQVTSDPNGGVCNVAWTTPGEWLEYDFDAPTAGAFTLVGRVASSASGKTIRLELDGSNIGTLSSPDNGWQAFADRAIDNVNLSAGSHTLRVVFETGDVNLNYLDIAESAVSCATPLSLIWPMPGDDTKDWVINNYVDLQPGAGVLDYNGGQKTYDGHRGIDIDVATFRDMDQGFPVFAAAEGVVEQVIQDNFDRNFANPCTASNWNVVDVRHPNGWLTRYGHLRQNSVTVNVGDTVVAGQQLGAVGSSGCSTQPHLHLETLDCDGEVIEPFQAGLWQEAPSYDPAFGLMETVLLAGGFGDSAAARAQMIDPAPNATSVPSGQLMGLGAHFGGGISGETMALWFRRPDGTVQELFAVQLSNAVRHGWWYWSSVPDGPSGTWSAEVVLNGAVVSTTPFSVN